MKFSARFSATVLVVATTPLVLGGSAQASDAETIRTGQCSGSADWKIKAKPDNGRIEVEAEIDSNQSGQTWRWTLKHNGSRSARGTSITTGRSGSFSLQRKTVNLPGTDTFKFRAVRNSGGQRCIAKITL